MRELKFRLLVTWDRIIPVKEIEFLDDNQLIINSEYVLNHCPGCASKFKLEEYKGTKDGKEIWELV